MKNPVSIRAALVVVATEVVFILCVAWVYAGMPGARLDTGAPSITIQFESPAPPPTLTLRSA